MKTAMQEMVEWIEEKFNNPKETETFKKATELLEKEKEQHKETWFRSTAQFDNSAEMTYKKLFEEHYNETYNQKETRVFGESNDKQFWSDKPNKNK